MTGALEVGDIAPYQRVRCIGDDLATVAKRILVAAHGFSRLPSKLPPAFGIDLHVDDSEGVRLEGVRHGFRVVVVRPDDQHWTRRVLDAVAHAQAA